MTSTDLMAIAQREARQSPIERIEWLDHKLSSALAELTEADAIKRALRQNNEYLARELARLLSVTPDPWHLRLGIAAVAFVAGYLLARGW